MKCPDGFRPLTIGEHIFINTIRLLILAIVVAVVIWASTQ